MNKSIELVKPDNCCLCQACIDSCPVQAIELKKYYNGFLYPEISKSKCINCGKCYNSCPTTMEKRETAPRKVYAAKNASLEIQLKSTSGGIFSAIAESLLEHNYYIYGVCFDENMKIKHQGIHSIRDLEKLRGSKYVQSDMSGIYNEIKQLLLKREKVLFCGCPCQVFALKHYLGNCIDNIVMIDVACHGILSPQLFNSYIDYLQKKYHKSITGFEFRNKDKLNWINSEVKVVFEDESTVSWVYYNDAFLKGYFSNIALKEECYHCSFRNFRSGSDLTIGDFWGIQKTFPDFYDHNGVSFICCNNENGENIIRLIGNSIIKKNANIQDVIRFNPGLIDSFGKHKNRNLYLSKISQMSMFSALQVATKQSFQKVLIRCIRRFGHFVKELGVKTRSK